MLNLLLKKIMFFFAIFSLTITISVQNIDGINNYIDITKFTNTENYYDDIDHNNNHNMIV